MTDEELETLIREMSEEIDRLENSEKPLTREEKRQKTLLQLQKEALERIKAAQEKGNLSQEVKAGVDYALLKQYGKKHPLLINYIKSQSGWLGF
jgi:hypothetical protein